MSIRIKDYSGVTHPSGVYRLYSEAGECLYVGSSACLLARLRAYVNWGVKNHPVAYIEYDPFPVRYLEVIEKEFIRRYKPKLNVAIPKRNDINLRHRFLKAKREGEWDKELNSLLRGFQARYRISAKTFARMLKKNASELCHT